MLATVVVTPAINGKAPQIPQPIKPKKNNFFHSFLKALVLLNIF